MANDVDGESLFKRPRLDVDAEADSTEILLSLRQSIQNVISSVAAQIELPGSEFAATSNLPGRGFQTSCFQTSCQSSSSSSPPMSEGQQKFSSSSSPHMSEGREKLEKIRKQIEWLNGSGGFNNRINCQKILDLAPGQETWFVLKLLKDLESKKHEVLDPTSFVTVALRRAAGNGQSLHSSNPRGESEALTLDSLQRMLNAGMGAGIMPGAGAVGGPPMFGVGALSPLPTLSPTGGTVLPSSPLLGTSGLSPMAHATMPAPFFSAPPANIGVTGIPSPHPMLGLNGFHGTPVLAMSSSIPPGNIALASAAAPAKSCIPPSVIAMMKKMKKDTVEETNHEKVSSLVAEASPPTSQLSLPEPLPWQQPVEQGDSMAQQLMATVAAIPMAQSTLTLPPKIAEEHPMAAQVFMLAQHAEESAQAAASTEAICKSLQDPTHKQVEVLAQSASQSAQKASWAVNFLDSYFPANQTKGESAEWFAKMRNVVKNASEVADNAAHACRNVYKDLKTRVPELTEDGRRSKVSPVPCKWFVNSVCRNGDNCDYSHDPAIFDPRPLDKKRAVECMYFQKGQCTRGAGCPFAHGAEELAEINKVVHTLRTEKRLPILTKRMMDIQKGKMPFTYSSP